MNQLQMNLDQLERQLTDQAALQRATDARLTALETEAKLEAMLVEMEAATGCSDAEADRLLDRWDAAQ